MPAISIAFFTATEAAAQKVFLVKGVLKICIKFTGEHPCRNVISIKLLYCFDCQGKVKNPTNVWNGIHIQSSFSKELISNFEELLKKGREGK